VNGSVKWTAAVAAALVVAALAAGAGTTAGGSSNGSTAAIQKGKRLQRFGSCAELLAYAKTQTLRLGSSFLIPALPPPSAPPPPGTPVPRAARPGVDYSPTNVQEIGVDEPDLVKTDGKHLFAVGEGKLQAIAVGTRPRLVDSLPLRMGAEHQLLLHGNRLIVLSRGVSEFLPLRRSMGYVPYPTKTILTEVDVHDPSSLRVLSRLELGGGYASARLAGGTLRVVLLSQLPRELRAEPTRPGETPAQAAARYRAKVSRSRLGNWMPSRVRTNVRTKKRTRRPLVGCTSVRRPPSFSGLGLLTVLTAELEGGLRVVDSDAVFADGQIVYSSTTGLYVATQRWSDTAGEQGVSTPLHKFDVSKPDRTEYRASGEVPGFLVNQWALDEQDGRLRVATTTAPVWWNGPARRESESFVTVLEEEGGKLVSVGRVGGLGKGERIYAVRFMEDVGYVVTFRQVDPLYIVDLSSPRRPRVAGELKIRGYSSYLHPIGDDLLLGVGQDATEQGRTLGTQVSVFDVRNLGRPIRLHRRTLESSSSEAEYDHHAFLYWPRTRLAVIPVNRYDRTSYDSFALGLRVGRGGIDEVGEVTHDQTEGYDPIRRSVVVGNGLYTVSAKGVKASDLADLSTRAWIAFR
jgi:Beta propeller domain